MQQEYIVQLQKLEVSADLNRIIKYHSASKIYLNKQTALNYRSVVEVKWIVENIDKVMNDPNKENLTIHPDYRYADIVDKILPDPSHENTLLVLVKNMIEIEWSYYASYFSKDEKGKFLINQHAEIKGLLQDLRVLKLQQESNTIIETKLTQREYGTAPDQESNRLYNVKHMQVEVVNREENLEIVNLLFKNRVNALRNPTYPIFTNSEKNIENWSITEIDKAISDVSQPFRDYRALWLFGKLVTETVLAYLKGEMNWNQGDTEITEKQGVYIYTLLVLFHLLKPEEELKFKSDRDKARYVRSFLRKDTKDTEESFYKFKFNADHN